MTGAWDDPAVQAAVQAVARAATGAGEPRRPTPRERLAQAREEAVAISEGRMVPESMARYWRQWPADSGLRMAYAMGVMECAVRLYLDQDLGME